MGAHAFNLALALAACRPRGCACGATPGGSACRRGGVRHVLRRVRACAVAGGAAGRAHRPALGGAVVIALPGVAGGAAGSEARGAVQWAGAGVTGAALGQVAGGLLTEAISWQSIFIVQIPLVLAAVPTALALRRPSRRDHDLSLPSDRPHVAANAALGLSRRR